MAERLLLRSQANTVFQAVREAGFDPELFGWETRPTVSNDDFRVSTLLHRPTGYFFQFDLARGKQYCFYSPGEDKDKDAQYPGTWEGQLAYAKRWLEYLKRETEAPDLWGSLLQERALHEGATSSEGEDRPLTESEIQYISTQLNELKEYIFQTQQLTSEQHDAVESRLNYLAASARRQTKTDWLHTLSGVLLSLSSI